MGLQIEDGTGTGRQAAVNSENNLLVSAVSASIQHHVSEAHGKAFQVQAIDSGITAKTQTILHLKNNSSTSDIVVTYVRLQAITTATLPEAGTYFEIGFDDDVASGGAELTSVNTNRNSGHTADSLATGGDPVMSDTMVVSDTQYVEGNGKEITYNKEGTFILGKNHTLSIRFTTTGTGVAKARISYLMIDKESNI